MQYFGGLEWDYWWESPATELALRCQVGVPAGYGAAWVPEYLYWDIKEQVSSYGVRDWDDPELLKYARCLFERERPTVEPLVTLALLGGGEVFNNETK